MENDFTVVTLRSGDREIIIVGESHYKTIEASLIGHNILAKHLKNNQIRGYEFTDIKLWFSPFCENLLRKLNSDRTPTKKYGSTIDLIMYSEMSKIISEKTNSEQNNNNNNKDIIILTNEDTKKFVMRKHLIAHQAISKIDAKKILDLQDLGESSVKVALEKDLTANGVNYVNKTLQELFIASIFVLLSKPLVVPFEYIFNLTANSTWKFAALFFACFAGINYLSSKLWSFGYHDQTMVGKMLSPFCFHYYLTSRRNRAMVRKGLNSFDENPDCKSGLWIIGEKHLDGIIHLLQKRGYVVTHTEKQ